MKSYEILRMVIGSMKVEIVGTREGEFFCGDDALEVYAESLGYESTAEMCEDKSHLLFSTIPTSMYYEALDLPKEEFNALLVKRF